MELWLLGGGAIVLIAITLWIVWPVQPGDGAAATVLEEPAETRTLEPAHVHVRVLGERFENRYVSAIADPPARETSVALVPSTYADPWARSLAERRGLPQPKTIGIVAGALLALGGAAGGAWLFTLWQRERNRPIKRLRRGARGLGPMLIVGSSAVLFAWRLVRSAAKGGE